MNNAGWTTDASLYRSSLPSSSCCGLLAATLREVVPVKIVVSIATLMPVCHTEAVLSTPGRKRAHDWPHARSCVLVAAIPALCAPAWVGRRARLPLCWAFLCCTHMCRVQVDIEIIVAEEEAKFRRADISGFAVNVDAVVARFALDPVGCCPLADAPRWVLWWTADVASPLPVIVPACATP